MYQRLGETWSQSEGLWSSPKPNPSHYLARLGPRRPEWWGGPRSSFSFSDLVPLTLSYGPSEERISLMRPGRSVGPDAASIPPFTARPGTWVLKPVRLACSPWLGASSSVQFDEINSTSRPPSPRLPSPCALLCSAPEGLRAAPCLGTLPMCLLHEDALWARPDSSPLQDSRHDCRWGESCDFVCLDRQLSREPASRRQGLPCHNRQLRLTLGVPQDSIPSLWTLSPCFRPTAQSRGSSHGSAPRPPHWCLSLSRGLSSQWLLLEHYLVALSG